MNCPRCGESITGLNARGPDAHTFDPCGCPTGFATARELVDDAEPRAMTDGGRPEDETDGCPVCGKPVEDDPATGDATITAEGTAHDECATHDEVDVLPDGGLETRTLRVGPARTVAYGPAGANAGEWALRFTSEDGDRVSVRLDEDAMYELWTEVHNVPWPSREDNRHDLQREIVARVEKAGPETLREVLDVLGGNHV